MIQAALDKVRSGESVLRAAKLHGVPKSILHDRVSGRVLHGHKPGPDPYLSVVEEKEIADFLVTVAKAGYRKTRQQVHTIAGMSAHDKRKVTSPMVSHGWFRRFLQRQPHLSYRRGDPTANVRMNCLSKEVMADYFELLREELTRNELMNKPNHIYNVDETGMCLDGHAPQVVSLKGQKKICY